MNSAIAVRHLEVRPANHALNLAAKPQRDALPRQRSAEPLQGERGIHLPILRQQEAARKPFRQRRLNPHKFRAR